MNISFRKGIFGMSAQMSKKKKKRTSTPENDSQFNFSVTLKSSLIGALISLAVSAGLALLFSAVAMLYNDPASLTGAFALAAVYISAFLSGFIPTRRRRCTGAVRGIFSGGILMLFYMILSVFASKELSSPHSFGISLLLHTLMILFSVLGAVAGAKRPARKHRRGK